MKRHAVMLMALALVALDSGSRRSGVFGQERQQTASVVISLLPGYTLERVLDGELLRLKGRIAKPDGLVITYDIGHNAGNQARRYAEGTRDAWTFSLTGPQGDSVTVTVDEPGQVAILTIAEDANFTAARVRTKRELAEMLAMVLTYDRAKHLGMKK